jgi:hypothetical protein
VTPHVVDRPLRLGEVLAETVRLYGERVWAALAIGAAFTGALVVGSLVHTAAYFAIAALAFGVSYGAAARIVAGDSLAEAWSQVAVRIPVLLVLCVAVALPFVITLRYAVVLLFGAAWLAFSGFAIPVAMLERDAGERSWFGRVAFALDRSVQLARAEYLHALGVAAALLVLDLVLSILLSGLLRGFADNSATVAAVLAGVLLWPLVFLGLSVLYFEQRARGDARKAPAGG